MANITLRYDLFRNAGAPLVGYKGNPFGYPGSCVTAQSAVFEAGAFFGASIVSAKWRVCWLPNITGASQTAVRLVSAESGPSNLQQLAAFFAGNNTTNPLNDAADITAAMQALVAQGDFFQLIHQTAGDNVKAPLIYSSAIELVVAV